MSYWRTARSESGGQLPSGPHHDADTRAVFEWVAENSAFDEPRGLLARTMFDVLTLIVWTLMGAIALMVIGSPFMFLWFLFFFH